jgi:hypothetical protein
MCYNYRNSDDDDCEGDCFGTNEGGEDHARLAGD